MFGNIIDKVTLISVDIATGELLYVDALVPRMFNTGLQNNTTHINVVLGILAKQFMEEGILPVDLIGVYNQDHKTYNWIENKPDYQVEKLISYREQH